MTPADKVVFCARRLWGTYQHGCNAERSDCDCVWCSLINAIEEYDDWKEAEALKHHVCVNGKTKDYPAVLCSRCKPQGQFVQFVEEQSPTDLRVKDYGEQ